MSIADQLGYAPIILKIEVLQPKIHENCKRATNPQTAQITSITEGIKRDLIFTSHRAGM